MKTIIAGSRTINNIQSIHEAVLKAGWPISEVVSGTAQGADTLGEQWAKSLHIPVTQFPADWDTHGRKAGFIRNCEMGDYADALLAIWDGQSRGTKHMIDYARKKGLQVFVHCV